MSYDNVNHPEHYTSHPAGIECIQITEHMNFCLGNALKYIWRADLKNDAIEDLEKAKWYIQREIDRRTQKTYVDIVVSITAPASASTVTAHVSDGSLRWEAEIPTSCIDTSRVSAETSLWGTALTLPAGLILQDGLAYIMADPRGTKEEKEAYLDLVRRVQDIDEEAARWMIEEAPEVGLPAKWDSRHHIYADMLNESFSWTDSPQGWHYWHGIERQLQNED